MEIYYGRSQIINWVSSLLQIKLDKIEDMFSGWQYCQMMDALFPGKVPINKVNFNAKLEYECMKNYKILQKVFKDLAIDKTIKLNELIAGKYQDHLEFLQWFQKFFEQNSQDTPYNASEKRKKAGTAVVTNTTATNKQQIGPRPSSTQKDDFDTTSTSSGGVPMETEDEEPEMEEKFAIPQDKPIISIPNNNQPNTAATTTPTKPIFPPTLPSFEKIINFPPEKRLTETFESILDSNPVVPNEKIEKELQKKEEKEKIVPNLEKFEIPNINSQQQKQKSVITPTTDPNSEQTATDMALDKAEISYSSGTTSKISSTIFEKATKDQLSQRIAKLSISLQNIERERDFYYTKLCEIEELCSKIKKSNPSAPGAPQSPSAKSQNAFLEKISDILYKKK